MSSNLDISHTDNLTSMSHIVNKIPHIHNSLYIESFEPYSTIENSEQSFDHVKWSKGFKLMLGQTGRKEILGLIRAINQTHKNYCSIVLEKRETQKSISDLPFFTLESLWEICWELDKYVPGVWTKALTIQKSNEKLDPVNSNNNLSNSRKLFSRKSIKRKRSDPPNLATKVATSSIQNKDRGPGEQISENSNFPLDLKVENKKFKRQKNLKANLSFSIPDRANKKKLIIDFIKDNKKRIIELNHFSKPIPVENPHRTNKSELKNTNDTKKTHLSFNELPDTPSTNATSQHDYFDSPPNNLDRNYSLNSPPHLSLNQDFEYSAIESSQLLSNQQQEDMVNKCSLGNFNGIHCLAFDESLEPFVTSKNPYISIKTFPQGTHDILQQALAGQIKNIKILRNPKISNSLQFPGNKDLNGISYSSNLRCIHSNEQFLDLLVNNKDIVMIDLSSFFNPHFFDMTFIVHVGLPRLY